MRKVIVLAALFSIALVSCSESNIQKAQDAAALVRKNCGVIVSIADIAAAFSVANPAVTTVAAMAHAICAQADRTENGSIQHYRGIVPVGFVMAQVEPMEPPPLPTQKPPMETEPAPAPEPLPVPLPEDDSDEDDADDDCVATVNGVCIRKEGDE